MTKLERFPHEVLPLVDPLFNVLSPQGVPSCANMKYFPAVAINFPLFSKTETSISHHRYVEEWHGNTASSPSLSSSFVFFPLSVVLAVVGISVDTHNGTAALSTIQLLPLPRDRINVLVLRLGRNHRARFSCFYLVMALLVTPPIFIVVPVSFRCSRRLPRTGITEGLNVTRPPSTSYRLERRLSTMYCCVRWYHNRPEAVAQKLLSGAPRGTSP